MAAYIRAAENPVSSASVRFRYCLYFSGSPFDNLEILSFLTTSIKSTSDVFGSPAIARISNPSSAPIYSSRRTLNVESHLPLNHLLRIELGFLYSSGLFNWSNKSVFTLSILPSAESFSTSLNKVLDSTALILSALRRSISCSSGRRRSGSIPSCCLVAPESICWIFSVLHCSRRLLICSCFFCSTPIRKTLFH